MRSRAGASSSMVDYIETSKYLWPLLSAGRTSMNFDERTPCPTRSPGRTRPRSRRRFPSRAVRAAARASHWRRAALCELHGLVEAEIDYCPFFAFELTVPLVLVTLLANLP